MKATPEEQAQRSDTREFNNEGRARVEKIEKYLKEYFEKELKAGHLQKMADSLLVACIRSGSNWCEIICLLKTGKMLQEEYRSVKGGNIYNFINPNHVEFAKLVKNITVGGNGGMGSVGKGEWMISLLSGLDPITNRPRVKKTKNGSGDLTYIDGKGSSTEEIKWNGGKLNISEERGRDVTKTFCDIIKKNNETVLNSETFVPFRKKNEQYENLEDLNAYYWEAITGKRVNPLSDTDLKYLFVKRAYKNLFAASNSIVIFDDDGTFVRFSNYEEAMNWYSSVWPTSCFKIQFECRASQNNPIALYCRAKY